MDYLFVFITAETCGACQRFRGNGILGNKHEYMTHKKLREILDTGVIYFNIHYNTHDIKNRGRKIIDISKFYKGKDNDVYQEKCYNHEGKTRSITVVMDHNEKPKVVDAVSVTKDKSSEKVDWDETVRNHVPKKIENYMGPYVPVVMVTRKKFWEESLKNGSPLLAVTDRGYTFEREGDYWLTRDHDSLYSRIVPLEDILPAIRNGSFKIETNIPGEVEPARPVLTEKEEKEKPGLGYRMVYYDDPE